MNHNLATPWADECSPPAKPELAFYSTAAEDLLFAGGGPIVLTCQAGRRSVALRWTLARNLFATPFRKGVAEALPANRFRVPLDPAGLHPGFYDLRVSLDTGRGRTVDGVCTFGYRVADIAVADTRPADFAAVWAEARTRVSAIPLTAHEAPLTLFTREQINAFNVACACLPPDYDPEGHACEAVESGKVSFAGPDGGRVFGWLAKPRGCGPFPAMLVLPGAGFAARPRPLEHARHGFLALDIQVHGQDVDLAAYPALAAPPPVAGAHPAEAHYYYRIHQRLVQAVNYLCSRPDVDTRRLVVVGGSQGGRLSVVLAGMDRRITAAIPAITHFANRPYVQWAESSARRHSDGMATACPPAAASADSAVEAYYDAMNFAPDITCPVLMNAGLVDPVSPPEGVWAVYNRLGSRDKAMVALPGCGHDWSAEFDRRAWRWLAQLPGA